MKIVNPYRESDKKKKVAPGGEPDVENTEEIVDPVADETPEEASAETVAEETALVEIEAPEAKEEPKREPKKESAPVVKEKVEPQPKVEKKPAKVANKIDALLGPAQKAKKQERSTMAVYLSKENQAWLKDMANQRGKSVSELLDQILNELRG